jgi:preprotein translocase subunit SecA
MIQQLLKLFWGDLNTKQLNFIKPIVEEINALEPQVSLLTDEQLTLKTSEFRQRIKDRLANVEHLKLIKDDVQKMPGQFRNTTDKALAEILDEILPEAFAVCREASKRVLAMRHFDVQLIGGIQLHRGGISEMQTGEGKTLVCTLAAYLNALAGRGVHVVTVNDYLAKRDSEWMGKLYNFLGLSVGLVIPNVDSDSRRAAYACDISWGLCSERLLHGYC